MKLKPEKNSDLNGIRTHDLCDTDTVFYQLSYQAFWELVILWAGHFVRTFQVLIYNCDDQACLQSTVAD